MSKGFKDLLQKVYECDRKTVAVAVAEDEPVLEAVQAAKEKGIADAILVGDEAKIREIAAGMNMDLTGYEIINRTIDKYGQFLFPNDIEANTWWTNLGMNDHEIISLYHAHGECEQFHSEIKTDMDLERLPSGKFDTNELVLELAIIAYNILRMIGQESIGRRGTETRHKVRRRRLRTVIGNMIMMAGHVTEHARQLIIGLGRSNVWRYAFQGIYTAFADFYA